MRFRRPTPRHIYVTFLQRTPCWWFSSRKTQSFRTPLAADCDWAHLWREFHALLNVCWLPLLNRNIFSKNPALSVICWHQIKVDAVDYPYTSKRFICIQRFPFKWLRDVFICRVWAFSLCYVHNFLAAIFFRLLLDKQGQCWPVSLKNVQEPSRPSVVHLPRTNKTHTGSLSTRSVHRSLESLTNSFRVLRWIFTALSFLCCWELFLNYAHWRSTRDVPPTIHSFPPYQLGSTMKNVLRINKFLLGNSLQCNDKEKNLRLPLKARWNVNSFKTL